MLHRYFNVCVYATLLLTLFCTSVRAQTVIEVMDFDGTTTEMLISTDVPFFSNGAQGFWGIHNANADDTDGIPADTDAAFPSRVALITSGAIQGDFLFVNDLDDSEGGNMNGTPGRGSVTFGPVTIPGAATNLLFSFDYDVANFNGGDEVFYTLVLNGVPQTEVHLIGASGGPQIGSGTVDVIIPDGTTTASLILGIELNGDQSAGFDNFVVTSDNPNQPCGVSSFGPTATETCAAFTNGTDDEYTLTIDYVGVDAGGTLALLVDGVAASSFTNNGDDPTITSGGTIDISSVDLLEGTSYEVTFSDGGDCAYSVTGAVATNTCVSVCDLSSDISMLRLGCLTFTSGGTDQVFGTLDYLGVESGATASITGSPGFPIVVSGDPGTIEDGEVAFGGLVEGGSYTITIGGGSCTGMDAIVIPFSVPAALCAPSDLVINEVLANPTGGLDVNQDGSINSDDEFVELYNNGTSDLDISGYTVEEFARIFHTFEAGTVLAPGEGILIIADIPPAGLSTPYGCYVVDANEFFIGLNNSGTDGVAVRDAAGNIVAQMTFTDAPVGESLALSPDGNLAGGYQSHTTVSATGAMSSPCGENIANEVGLPVELLSFSAVADEKEVLLTWSTANEIDNDHFVVERRSFNREWQSIGTVFAGRGTENNYKFSDDNPLNGDNFYRLRQLDFTGNFSLHGPVMAAFTTDEFLVFPNPAATEIRFGGTFSTADRISLHDANGRLLKQVTPGADRAGLADLKRGVYLVRVANDRGTEIIRFVKQ
ncbi:lamin tail domain-containing protein [Neolewinella persica]|uniref:lamin tail domain-containing protein n=1 Tax=Neolewinella persica TaxID=70998 RepID=UPI00035E1C2F|nr:lamin tail domain-containing protein [Neolewinella persica]